ncbi:hypothetical protein EV193_102634 [Herbihabitans rhizosphaerae]|uniref:Uncharacterized protein n=1 Tax=Herbihabitans rhizosphaerae TaxID=1872711 RepID=A0A4V2EU81_9PSEU|nr:hypothetical protein [Herbihabitans rhizosphaerae]RZS43653.1 hypothetical protein EV193_102634 [Herbihabitans rhizosphaerae]
MTADRSLEALGFDRVPALDPLCYPGRAPAEPMLLHDRRLSPFTVAPGGVGDWPLAGQPLDSVLTGLGVDPITARVPSVAVGSNASPAQLCHKLGPSAIVPMVPVRVRGVGIGVSSHISRAGYVSASPYADPGVETTIVVAFLDAEQLAAVDATEVHYHRVLLPHNDFRVTLRSGERLDGGYLYVHRRGVLADSQGTPRRLVDQPTLLSTLLAESSALRALFGDDPAGFVAAARADEALRAAGAQVFADEGWFRATDRVFTISCIG